MRLEGVECGTLVSEYCHFVQHLFGFNLEVADSALVSDLYLSTDYAVLNETVVSDHYVWQYHAVDDLAALPDSNVITD